MMSEPIFQAEKCPLTGFEKPKLKVVEQGIRIDYGKKGHQWYYPFGKDFLMIVENELFLDQVFWDTNRTAIYYLIENGIWPKGKMVDKTMVEVFLSSSNIPKTPYEKMEEILSFISSNQKHFGEWFWVDMNDCDSIVRKTGMFNSAELEGIIRESNNYGFLEIKADNSSGMTVILSLKGWETATQRNQEKQSNTVFVAMSFDEDMISIYNGFIEPAIKECGFKPYIIFKEYPESDVTINDAILAGIKKAKFTIADFTHHKSGVYFEAGYALGRGQKVIYTCQEDHISTAHFDTRNYQHLVWKDGADLKKKLMDKIEVFIKS